MEPKNRVSDMRTRVAMVIRGLAPPVSLFALALSLGCGGGNTSTATNNGNGGGGGGPVPTSVNSTIAVGTAPSAIAVDSTANKIYVADSGTQPPAGAPFCPPTGADVTVIDGATASPTAVPLAGAVNPIAIALNPGSHTAYVVEREWGPGLFGGKGCFWEVDGVAGIDTSTLGATRVYSGITAGRRGFLG